MTHCVNELADLKSDSANRNGTPWTAGSGAIAAGLAGRKTAVVAAFGMATA